VRSGALTVPQGSFPTGGNPNTFGFEIQFSTPYLYDGQDLLITLRHTGQGNAGLDFFMDSINNSLSTTVSDLTLFQKIITGQEAVVTGKGPFSVDENRSIIQCFGVRVLVTKDSGAAGGVPEKLEAARLEGCRVVVVRRPKPPGVYFDQMESLMPALLAAL